MDRGVWRAIVHGVAKRQTLPEWPPLSTKWLWLQGRCRRRGWSSGGAVGGAGVSYTRRQDGMKPLRGVRRNKLGQSQRGLQVTENQWKGPESRWWRWHRHRRQAEGSFWRGPGQMSRIRSFGSLGDLVNQESMKSDDEQGCHEEFQHYCHR